VICCSGNNETVCKRVESSVPENPTEAEVGNDVAPSADASDAVAVAEEVGEVRRHARIYSGLNPRGLIDGLTRFFTPSDRRGPRVCRDSESPASNSPNRIRRRRRHRQSSESALAPPRPDSITSSSVLCPSETDLPPASAEARLAAVPASVPLTSASTSTSTSTSPRHRRRGSGIRRRREQLVDGLSDFFKAVGKRRSCIPLRLRHDGALRGAEPEPELENCDRVKSTASDFSVRSTAPSKCVASTRGGAVRVKRLSVDVRASASSSCERLPTGLELRLSRNAIGK
jgi:hypothetical protein